MSGYVWWALAGAAAVSVLVYAVGGNRSATPVRLALAGTALTALLQGWTSAVELTDNVALDRMRFWQVGSLAAADMAPSGMIAPFVAVGARPRAARAPARSTRSRSATTPPAASAPG